jgi:hypothetical protein
MNFNPHPNQHTKNQENINNRDNSKCLTNSSAAPPAIFSKDKITEIFCLEDEFRKFFDVQQEKQHPKFRKTAKE